MQTYKPSKSSRVDASRKISIVYYTKPVWLVELSTCRFAQIISSWLRRFCREICQYSAIRCQFGILCLRCRPTTSLVLRHKSNQIAHEFILENEKIWLMRLLAWIDWHLVQIKQLTNTNELLVESKKKAVEKVWNVTAWLESKKTSCSGKWLGKAEERTEEALYTRLTNLIAAD